MEITFTSQERLKYLFTIQTYLELELKEINRQIMLIEIEEELGKNAPIHNDIG